MKKILIGAVLASSLAMSGDLAKCSEAMEQKSKHHKLSVKDGKAGIPLEKSWNTDLYFLWHDVSLKECKGVLNDKSYKRYSNSLPMFFKKLKKKRERIAKEQKLKEEARKEQEEQERKQKVQELIKKADNNLKY